MTERAAILHDDGTWEWGTGGNYLGGMECAAFVSEGRAEKAASRVQELEGELARVKKLADEASKQGSIGYHAYRISELLGLVKELEGERDEARRHLTFSHEWYAERFAAIRDIAKEKGIWDEVASIMANGTRSATDPPTYAQQLNAAKYRAKAAEAHLARLEEALEPFAKFADRLDGEWDEEAVAEGCAPDPIWQDDEPIDHGLTNDGPEITVADIRKARSLLTHSTPPRSDG